MKALTVWQPWASLIVHGLKTVEWRGYAFPPSLRGQRLVIHAGKPNPEKGIKHLLAERDAIRKSCGPDCDVAAIREALDRMLSRLPLVPVCAGIGEVTLVEPESAQNLYARHGIKLGGSGPWNWAWKLRDPVAWPHPIEARGAQGFWPWPHRISEAT